jgi:hypothetical protein
VRPYGIESENEVKGDCLQSFISTLDGMERPTLTPKGADVYICSLA